MIRMSTDLPSGARAHLWISDEPRVFVMVANGQASVLHDSRQAVRPDQMQLLADALAEASLLTEDGAA